MSTVSSLPDGPLELDTVIELDGGAEYGKFTDSNDVVAMILIGQERAHGLGYDPNSEGWIRFDSVLIENTDDGPDILEGSVKEWFTTNYGDEIASGDVTWIEPGDRKKHRRPKEVEMGLEPEYDCPDCGYYETGLTISPHGFLDHLQDEHEYSRSDAFDVLN